MLYVFDWDGTLVDSIGRIVESLKLAAAELSLEMLTDQQYREVIGLGLTEAVNHLYPMADERLQVAMKEAYSKHFVAADVAPCPFFCGVTDTLEALHKEGHHLAVATGKSRRGLDRVLTQLQWHDYFHATRCADETASKPHPLMLHEIMDALGVPSHEAVMVGDTDFDLHMAHHAGMRSVGVSYGAHNLERLEAARPSAIIHRFTDLLEVI
ncbi:MAG TPA: HAD-IA family hydrolase [Pseudomonadales bacterium]|nr:HAD-IA family hydrolase [Pseudomonadales bacterium]